MRIPIGPFCAIFAGLVSLFSIFLFPTIEPGAVMIWSTGKIVAKPHIVKLSPVFGRGSKNKLYSFTIAPKISEYTEEVSSSDQVVLLATSVRREFDGNSFSDWSFAWDYWLLLDAIPSAILSFVILWILQRRQSKTPNFPLCL